VDEPSNGGIGSILFGGKGPRKGGGKAKQEKGPTEEFKVKEEALLTKVREIVHEANVRRIIIEDGEGKTLIEVPLTMVSWASWSRPSPRLSERSRHWRPTYSIQ
jgi:hypothetical protein